MTAEPWPGAPGERCALIVASNDYQDPGLDQLLAPAADAEALAHVLRDPMIGGFTVTTLLNQPTHLVNEAVEEFFAERSPDDLLLLHFSGHGIKDPSGELYFAMANTRLRLLAATAVAANFVNRLMTQSRSRRIVLFLDCCYAGAFERGMSHRSGQVIDLESRFEGRGRAVITASGAVEYAFEAGELTESNEPKPSVFTTAMVRGLSTGDADRDQDGYIDLDELYDYVFGAVRDVTPHQTPGKWAYGIQGDLVIARRSVPVRVPAALPPELEQSMESPLAGVRVAAAGELAKVLAGSHQGRALAARQALEKLSQDDSTAVVAAATAALDPAPGVLPSHETGGQSVVRPETVERLPPRPRLSGRRGVALAAIAIVLLVGGILAWQQKTGHSSTIPSSFDGVWVGNGPIPDESQDAEFTARLGEGQSVAQLSSGNSSCYAGPLSVSDATESELTTSFVSSADPSEGCPDWTVTFTHDGDDLIMHVDPESSTNNRPDFEIRLSPSS